jgi:hypothetical protein
VVVAADYDRYLGKSTFFLPPLLYFPITPRLDAWWVRVEEEVRSCNAKLKQELKKKRNPRFRVGWVWELEIYGLRFWKDIDLKEDG